MAENDPASNFKYNAALPAYLAYMSKQSGVKRFIYASSCSIYGYLESQLSSEDHAPNCHFPYGISKYLGERGSLQVQGDGFSVIALRKGTIGGHSPRMRFDLIVNTMTRAALTKGAITVDSPSLWRPILDVRSAVTAYLRAVEADPGLSGAFNIADDNYTVGAVADIVAETVRKAAGVPVDIVSSNAAPESHGRTRAALRNYKVDCSRARYTLGWVPKYTIEDTVVEIVSKWKGGEYGKDLYDRRFSNIETWKTLPQR
jgi:nucleoside-diphosphate-sugar epimerase